MIGEEAWWQQFASGGRRRVIIVHWNVWEDDSNGPFANAVVRVISDGRYHVVSSENLTYIARRDRVTPEVAR